MLNVESYNLAMKFFWDLYARIYDSLSQLAPYRQLMTHMVTSAELRDGEVVLDAGCGTGNLSSEMIAEGRHIRLLGLDASPVMLGRARSKVPSASFSGADLNQVLPLDDASVDVVACSNVLYALPRPQFTLTEFRRILKPGGRIVVATPRGKVSLWQLIEAHLSSGQGAIHWLRCLLLAVPIALLVLFNLVVLKKKEEGTFHFVDEDQLRGWFVEAGFEVRDVCHTYADQDLLVTASAGERSSSVAC